MKSTSPSSTTPGQSVAPSRGRGSAVSPLLTRLLAMSVVLGALRVTGIFTVSVIDGQSMEPTLHHGQGVAALRLPLREGRIVLARLPDGQTVIKRVTAIDGDRVHLQGDNPLSETYDVSRHAVRGRVVAAFDIHGLFRRPATTVLEETARWSLLGRVVYAFDGVIYCGSSIRHAHPVARGDRPAWVGEDHIAYRRDGAFWLKQLGARDEVELCDATGFLFAATKARWVAFECHRHIVVLDHSAAVRVYRAGDMESIDQFGKVIYARHEGAYYSRYAVSPAGWERRIEHRRRYLLLTPEELDLRSMVSAGQASVQSNLLPEDAVMAVDRDVDSAFDIYCVEADDEDGGEEDEEDAETGGDFHEEYVLATGSDEQVWWQVTFSQPSSLSRLLLYTLGLPPQVFVSADGNSFSMAQLVLDEDPGEEFAGSPLRYSAPLNGRRVKSVRLELSDEDQSCAEIRILHAEGAEQQSSLERKRAATSGTSIHSTS